MAYTRNWDDTKPTGSEAANTIDDLMRELKEDIHERMDDLVVDWTDDPVVLKATAAQWFAKSYAYNDLTAPGNKAQNPTNIKAILHLKVRCLTGPAGNVTINLNEIADEIWSASNFVGLVAMVNNVSSTAICYVDTRGLSINEGANTITLPFRNYDGSFAGFREIDAWVTMYFSAIPTPPSP